MEGNVQEKVLRDISVRKSYAYPGSVATIADDSIACMVPNLQSSSAFAKPGGKYASEESKAIKEMAKHLNVSDVQVDALDQFMERAPEMVNTHRVRIRKPEYLNHKIPNHENDEIV